MTTNTNTGWIREFPRTDGVYFTRVDTEDLAPIPVRVEQAPDGVFEVFEFGISGDCSDSYQVDEWLGPITPADFEELGRLRSRVAELESKLRDMEEANLQAGWDMDLTT